MGFFYRSLCKNIFYKERKAMIKELLQQEQEIWVRLTKQNRAAFLRQAKAEGFCYFNGKQIDESDDTFLIAAVSANGTIAKVPCFCLSSPQFANVKRIDYQPLQ